MTTTKKRTWEDIETEIEESADRLESRLEEETGDKVAMHLWEATKKTARHFGRAVGGCNAVGQCVLRLAEDLATEFGEGVKEGIEIM